MLTILTVGAVFNKSVENSVRKSWNEENSCSPLRYYTIIAPKVVRPDSEYHVAASVTGVSTPSTIYVELTGELDSGKAFNISRTAVVEPYSTQILRLDVRINVHSSVSARINFKTDVNSLLRNLSRNSIYH